MDAGELVTVEVWVMVGEDGQYACHTDPDALRERFEEECADAGLTTRVLRLTVKLPAPKPAELVATIADEPATGELKVARTKHERGREQLPAAPGRVLSQPHHTRRAIVKRSATLPLTAEQRELASRPEHVRLAERLAAALARRYGIAFEDARASALFGLVQAARRYRPELGAFADFTAPHVRGTAVDDLRKWIGRRGPGRCSRLWRSSRPRASFPWAGSASPRTSSACRVGKKSFHNRRAASALLARAVRSLLAQMTQAASSWSPWKCSPVRS